MISVVAARYAKALADVVTAGVHASTAAQADSAQITAQLRAVDEMIDSSTELKNALASPAVAPSRKRAVMARLVEPMNLSAQVRNFLFVVIDHGRVQQLESIIEAFENLADERLGFVRADVASTYAMTEAQRAALEVQLSRLAGKKTRLRYTTDPALVAGVVAKVGSTVYDGSVRGQLERLRVKLGSQ
jgi:F-type H+-transporting ATPase subunit delta